MARVRIDITDEDALDALLDDDTSPTKRERRGCGKVRYSDKDQAIHAMHRIVSRSGREKQPERAYDCHRCKGWHLTSQAKDGTAGEIVDLDAYRDWLGSQTDDEEPDPDGPSGGSALPVPQRAPVSEIMSRIALAARSAA